MASTLVNLQKTLAWSDFTPKPLPVPPAGQRVDVALTDSHFETAGIMLNPVTKTTYKFDDTFVVTIVFNPGGSWVADWVSTRPQAFQDNLLVHEQGHYNITALIGRDFFQALLLLLTKTYTNSASAKADLTATRAKFLAQAQPTSDRYDLDTQNGTDLAKQSQWNGFMSTAFGQTSNTLSSVLSGAGIVI